MRTVILAALIILLSAPAYAKRERPPEPTRERPAMSQAHSNINDALEIQKKAQQNMNRANRQAYEMLEQGRYVTEDAKYNNEIHQREKNRNRNK